MVYHINKVLWETDKQLLRQIRERVFVYELHIPKHIEFDHLDTIAQHVLVTDQNKRPVATGRLCKKGFISRIAVLPEHRNRSVYQTLLNFLVSLAEQQGLKKIYINCILSEVDRFEKSGFSSFGNVFMVAGIARQGMECAIDNFNTKPFTLTH